MNMAEMSQQDRHDLEKFRDTERKRERDRQIRYQQSLGPALTWRERELKELEMFESQWKRGMVPKTY
jgi:hypothetical protein